MTTALNPTTDVLLLLLDQCFDRKAWHGPHVKAALRGVDPREAGWRPQPGRHSVAEQVLHIAYWKYSARRRLVGGKRGAFPMKGSNWFPVTDRLTPAAWSEFLRVLDEQHADLRAAVVSLGSTATAWTDRQLRLVTGIAAHDVYHAGQIRLLRSTYADRR